jgi:hypothetical protein
MMDEVDGRPGAVAIQSGHVGASSSVLAEFLSQRISSTNHSVILSERGASKDLRLLSFSSIQLPRLDSGAEQPEAVGPIACGEDHENLSGK